MIQANMHEAKSQLSKLIERAEAGGEVMIARAGRPVVRLQVSAPLDIDGPAVAGLSWAEWRALNREIEMEFEAAINAPDPWLEDRPPEPSPEEVERLRSPPLEALVEELTLKP